MSWRLREIRIELTLDLQNDLVEQEQIANLVGGICHCGESSVESSSAGDDCEGSGGMEVEIAD